MEFEVVLTDHFKRKLKIIAKKHRNILSDVTALVDKLTTDPLLGNDLGRGIYKIRLAITGPSKGKSGGARVITYVKIVASTVVLAEIYLKSDYDTADVDKVLKILTDEKYI